ncbi:Sec-independent protein translocase protein TatB [Labrenzia sp. OB1]|uniref:Sec-independent protein translocase protein TatB n=1 Tax=Labrenzia sp. OB1 TaxID=1561204 RepID=UPI0007B17D58|nr:Sec-independent protein translocase protein TatB [Labrenzia sp. OB1]KZM49819.1 preprotein translocase subunit TatA [Labrenzia sp. OB1]
MFDIGWTELLVIACVAIIVVGPKDLPRMLRTLGQTMGKMRRMSREFQSTFNDALREAESHADIADMKKQVEKAANFDPLGDIKKSIQEDAAKPPDKPKAAAAEPVSEDQSLRASGETAVEKPSSEPKAATRKKPAKKPVTEDVKA